MCRAKLDRRRQMECQCGMEATWQWGPSAPLCRCLVQDSLQGSRRGRTAAAAAAPLLASSGGSGGGAGEEDTNEECQHDGGGCSAAGVSRGTVSALWRWARHHGIGVQLYGAARSRPHAPIKWYS